MVLLGLVVVLSGWLRLTGITWGLESGYGHYLNYQPDEFISMRGMLPIQLHEGKLKARDAYFEGTFNYYLWSIPEMSYRISQHAPALPDTDVPADRFKFVLLSGRLMTVAFDLAALAILYAILLEITGLPTAALFGAFLYGILPMQVVYSHFMRTHVLSNLLCVMVIWFSLMAVKHQRWWLYLAAGLLAGLGGATRYPIATILSIPVFLIIFAKIAEGGRVFHRLRQAIYYLLSGPAWLLGGGFVVGLFLGFPLLFLDFQTVVGIIRNETLSYVPAGATKLLDLVPLTKYFTVLIPDATYPFLWLVLYAGTLLVIVRRTFWPVVWPLVLFCGLYAYPMAKGYIVVFARQVMVLLPILCLFAGLAWADLSRKVPRRSIPRFASAILLSVLILPSLLFDWAYVQAMRGRDVRAAIRKDLSEITKSGLRVMIGVSESGGYFYTAMPGVFPLNGGLVTVRLQESNVAADFFVIGFERPINEARRRLEIKRVEDAGRFRFLREYSRSPSVFGRRFDLTDLAPDMTYPFPAILLFEKVEQPSI